MSYHDRKVAVVANSLGWQIYGYDGRNVVYRRDGVATIMVTDEEAKWLRKVAQKVVDDLYNLTHGLPVHEATLEGQDSIDCE